MASPSPVCVLVASPRSLPPGSRPPESGRPRPRARLLAAPLEPCWRLSATSASARFRFVSPHQTWPVRVPPLSGSPARALPCLFSQRCALKPPSPPRQRVPARAPALRRPPGVVDVGLASRRTSRKGKERRFISAGAGPGIRICLGHSAWSPRRHQPALNPFPVVCNGCNR